MKKAVILLALWVLIFVAVPGFCTESVVETTEDYGDIVIVSFTVTAAADGSVTDTAISTANTTLLRHRGLFLYSIETNPGSPSPTEAYDVSLVDVDGLDMCASQANDRSATVTESVVCATATQPYQPVRSTMTLNIDNNNVNSATLVIRCVFAK